MGSKAKKPNQESIELDQFLSELTEVELETDSKTIFSLCETARDVDFYKNERSVLDSFIKWARSESRKFKRGVANLDNGEAKAENVPNEGEISPVILPPLIVRGMPWA